MATKQSHLLLLLVALFLVFSLVLADEKSINGVKRVEITDAVGKVDQLGRLGLRQRCISCGIIGYCCAFRPRCCGSGCCTAEEYKEYIMAQGVPHN